MVRYHIVQLNSTNYVIFDADFNKVNKDAKVLSESYKKDSCILSLGNTILFIQKNKAFYDTYLKFAIPQLRRAIDKYGEKIPKK